ncbi:mRNA export protein mlo3 [Escovopsis weberi]|uniref:mRNA export protein mlo3 n=1 Tax=Escovopsis weberi TaxID=150374 RepID=A0A0M8N3C7_ESCWE|nr:mRNA export protein mlo3 [Escovopsis weberi]
MSGKLDKPLDEIVTAQRRSSGRRTLRRPTGGRPAPAAPAGGVKKNSAKPTRTPASKAAPAKAAASTGDSKAIPRDVTENQIKEYFVQSVGPIKKVELVYGPNSQSRGIANVTFQRADGASKALQNLNGLLVDGRPIKIEIVFSAAQADKIILPVKTLAERTSSAAAGKKQPVNGNKGNAPKGAAAQAANKKRQGRNARPAKKTAEELDSEMADYFESAANGNTENPAAPAAAAPNGDAAMEDEIMTGQFD